MTATSCGTPFIFIMASPVGRPWGSGAMWRIGMPDGCDMPTPCGPPGGSGSGGGGGAPPPPCGWSIPCPCGGGIWRGRDPVCGCCAVATCWACPPAICDCGAGMSNCGCRGCPWPSGAVCGSREGGGGAAAALRLRLVEGWEGRVTVGRLGVGERRPLVRRRAGRRPESGGLRGEDWRRGGVARGRPEGWLNRERRIVRGKLFAEGERGDLVEEIDGDRGGCVARHKVGEVVRRRGWLEVVRLRRDCHRRAGGERGGVGGGCGQALAPLCLVAVPLCLAGTVRRVAGAGPGGGRDRCSALRCCRGGGGSPGLAIGLRRDGLEELVRRRDRRVELLQHRVHVVNRCRRGVRPFHTQVLAWVERTAAALVF